MTNALAHRQSRRIVFTHGGGRFANQLMLFGHLIALVEECPDLSICNYSFWPYANLCNGTERNPLCLYPAQPSRFTALANSYRLISAPIPTFLQPAFSRSIGQLMHVLKTRDAIDYVNDAADLADPAVRHRFRQRPWTLLAGWKLRDWIAFQRHSATIRTFLRPADRYVTQGFEYVQSLRKSHRMVIGLLMRQTDYRRWNHGEFFLPSQQYRLIIDHLWKRFGDDALILVTSDERQDKTLFDHPHIRWMSGTAGGGHFMQSFCQLGLCDLVVSVPSTFAAWAAFIGQVPFLCCAGDVESLANEPIMSNPLLDALGHRHFGKAMFW